MKAKLIYRDKVVYSNGAIMEMVLWKLPASTKERPHGIKYRLYFGDNQGQCLVRHDNEAGKDDHKHIGKNEFPYLFTNVDNLVNDFIDDIKKCGYIEEDEL